MPRRYRRKRTIRWVWLTPPSTRCFFVSLGLAVVAGLVVLVGQDTVSVAPQTAAIVSLIAYTTLALGVVLRNE